MSQIRVTANTTGAIANANQQAAQQQIAVKQKTPATMMSGILNNEQTKKMLQETLKDNAGAFSASVLDLYSNDKYLSTCDPTAVFRECLKAVALKLPINKALGFAYVVPYDNKPTFQIGYKGLIQLAMRTGAYKYINADEVYEGELKKVSKLTGEVDLNGEVKSDTVIGYFAYIETLNGFSKTLYWSKDKLLAHVKKFSKSYKANSAIWRDNFKEMAIKTVLRNLLSKWGIMSVEMETAMTSENADLADQQIAEANTINADYVMVGQVDSDGVIQDDPEQDLPDFLQ